MSKAKVSEMLDALNRCLPLTAEDDKGCDGCPYEKICAEGFHTAGLPMQLVEDLREHLKTLAGGENG